MNPHDRANVDDESGRRMREAYAEFYSILRTLGHDYPNAYHLSAVARWLEESMSDELWYAAGHYLALYHYLSSSPERGVSGVGTERRETDTEQQGAEKT